MIVGSEVSRMRTETVISFPSRSYDKLFVTFAERATIRFKSSASSSTSIEGVLVTEVLPGSAASSAGLKEGDIITKFGGEIIDDTRLTMRIHHVGGRAGTE